MKTVTLLRLSFLVLLATGAAVFLVGWSVLWLLRGSYPTAIVVFAGALYLLGFGLHMAYVLWGTPTPRTEFGKDGTVIRPPKAVDQMFFMSFLSAVLASGLYLVFMPFGKIDFRLPDAFGHVDLAICVFLLVFGIPTLFRAFLHGGESYLRLDPNGFEVWNGFWASFVRGRWDDVGRIQNRPLKGRSNGREIVVIGRLNQRTAMFMSDSATANSEALLEWVRFYWQHPEYRGELVDNRGLRRLEEQKFTVG